MMEFSHNTITGDITFRVSEEDFCFCIPDYEQAKPIIKTVKALVDAAEAAAVDKCEIACNQAIARVFNPYMVTKVG